MPPKSINSSIPGILILSVGYFLLGIFGLQLAVPPGYASAIFPAAGVGAAAVLYVGRRLLPGIWLGSFALNIWIAFNHGYLDIQSVPIAGIIALGACLQAWFTIILLHLRLKEAWRGLDKENDIIGFLLIAGPFACLVSATWGNCTLLLFKVISLNELGFNWWNWWVGDTIGVLLFTPLTLIILQRQNKLWKARLIQVTVPTLVATAGIFVAFIYVASAEKIQFKHRIEEQGIALEEKLQDKLSTYEEIVTSLSNLVLVKPKFNAFDFEKFTRNDLMAHPDLQALSWNPIIPNAGRKQFEETMSRELSQSGFQILQNDLHNQPAPAEDREQYVVVHYISPLDRNRQALGYDIASDPIRRSAIHAAIQSGKPTITPPIQLVQETVSNVGLLLLHPVYLDHPIADLNIGVGNQKPYGFAVGIFRIEEMLSRLLTKNLSSNLGVVLEDKNALDENKYLYRSNQVLLPQFTSLSWEGEIPIGGRIWSLSVYPTPDYFIANRSVLAWVVLAWVVLAAGLILASFLQAFLLVLTGRAAIIQRLVNEQTLELSRKEEFLRLSQSCGGIGTWEADFINKKQIWSEICFDLLGFPTKNEPTWEDFLAVIHPDDRRMVISSVQSHIEFGTKYDVEYRTLTADGNIRWMRSSGQVQRDEAKKPLHMRGIVQDVTERKQAELDLFENTALSQAILNAVSEGLHGLNQDGKIIFENPAATAMLGWNAQEMIGHPAHMLIHHSRSDGSPYPQCECHIYATLADGVTRHIRNEVFWRKDGSCFPVDYTSTAMRNTSGEIIGVIVSFRDITELKQAEEDNRRASEYARSLIEASLDPLVTISAEGMITDVNTATEKVTGLSREKLIGSEFAAYFTDRQKASEGYRQVFLHGYVTDYPLAIRHASGIITDVLYNASVYRDALGNVLGVFAAARDITERKQAELKQRIAATAFESQEGMLITDAANIILQVNKAFTSITGYSAEEVVGQKPSFLQSGRHDQDFYASMWECINATGAWEGEIWNKRKNGEIFPEYLTISAVKDRDGIVTHYVATLTDITQKKAAAEEIERLAFYDPLTGVPNRRLLQDRLKPALANCHRTGRHCALLFIDLDNFKTINDTLGHDMGDLLLKQVADRLASCIRESDTIARLGGDEFVLMLEDLSEQALEAATQAEIIGKKILDLFKQPFSIKSHEYISTASIGVTLFCSHKQSIEELLKHADIAMYQAKTSGRNTLRFFDPKMQLIINQRVAMESGLRKALLGRQFQLYYQIQIDSSGTPLGAEALIRWFHPERGLISPADFIPLAEETGLIIPIGQWVLETACARLKDWEKNPMTRDLVLSVNVSAKQFFQSSFVEQVFSIVQHYAINPNLLKLELTESVMIENIENTIETMLLLVKAGIKFSLDDFGTGYSSLQYLKKLPLDQLKIDQSFIRDFAVDSGDQAIVCTIIAMAKTLNLNVIAEGVETEEQRQLLQLNGCTNYQGYLFSRPLPIDRFEALLKTG